MKKYWIITFGCQMNEADSERIASFLEKKKYLPILKERNKYSSLDLNVVRMADLIVVNMCSVRQSAVDRIYGLVKNLQKIKKENKNKKPKIILTGCILKKDKLKFKKVFDFIWEKEIFLNSKPKHKNKYLANIPVSNGCNNFCSYCAVPFSRGSLVCRSHKKIIKEAKNAIKQGKKELWLLGQNVNDYKSPCDKKIDFAKIIKEINNLPGNFKFFFLSPHPKNFSDKLINVLAKSEKFGKKINLPIQSGDNQILKKMNRNYTVQEYKILIKKLIKKIPEIKISTDIIVGFPGETKKQFKNTEKLFKEIKFSQAYINKYSIRPGTAASLLKDNISLIEKKKREKCLRKLLLS